MTYRFNPRQGHVLVITKLWGPLGEMDIPLALDTGAVKSVLSWQTAALLGYDPACVADRARVVSATGEVWVPRLTVAKIEALGQERREFPFLCHTLPAAAGLDGLLGLDFFRGHRLVVDFRAGLLSIE